MAHLSSPFTTRLLNPTRSSPATIDGLPACFRRHDRKVELPGDCLDDFLSSELSLERLEVLGRYFWFAGARRPPKPLHYHIFIGREIIITEQMDLHLLWANNGRIFIKPLPAFLLSPEFWSQNLSCPASCRCKNHLAASTNNIHKPEPKSGTDTVSQACQRRGRLRQCAIGFVYTYTCLLSYESDFLIAIDRHLLPRLSDGSPPSWETWKGLVREILTAHDLKDMHPRFCRAELRLARLDTIHRLTQFPPFEPYLRGRRNYGSLFRDNITWLASATIFVALILTAMQVGLATDQLKESESFMAASYGFTVFAILGPLCVFGLIILEALYYLLKDLPWLLSRKPSQTKESCMNAETADGV